MRRQDFSDGFFSSQDEDLSDKGGTKPRLIQNEAYEANSDNQIDVSIGA